MATTLKRKAAFEGSYRESTSSFSSSKGAKRIKKARSSPTQLSPARTTSFHGLPRELRNMIYHELWKETPIIGGVHKPKGRGLHQTVFYDDASPNDEHGRAIKAKPLPLWLRTNKMFLDEGLAQLRVKGHWQWQLNVKNVRRRYKPPPRGLLQPGECQKITIAKFCELRDRNKTHGGPSAPGNVQKYGIEKNKLQMLRWLLDDLRGKNNARELKLDIHGVFRGSLTAVDLSPLHSLKNVFPQLESLEVGLAESGLKRFWHDSYPVSYRSPALREELRKVATIALGENVSGTRSDLPRKDIDVAEGLMRFKRT